MITQSNHSATFRPAVGALALALLPLAVLPASAQQIELRAADSLPTGHYIAESLIVPFMEKVSARTGQTEFAYFPAQQLGKAKDLLSLTQTGVSDIGYVGPSYVSDKMPLSAVGQLPEAFSTSCEGTMAFWGIAKPGGALDQAEFAPNGVRLLMAMVLPPYNLLTSSREITGLESMKGLKIRSTGGALDLTVQKIGGVPVQMPAPEVREALSRGTVDAGLFPYPSVPPYGMEVFLDWGTQDLNFGSFVATYVISLQKWNSLPEDVQQAMTEIGADLTMEGCATADQQNAEVKLQIANAGVTFVDLPAEDTQKLVEILSTVGSEWAAELDGQGKPGTEILEAFRAALAKD
ncbi:TRAP transporter substrate-binding protein DctP [Seohaeicola sp. SP36]|uniref:TRAP transporter substrate-binding protein n=1 Tax=unclassified Seohaeicola TaxID=2641111 RepID=UPI00237C2240|nr:MULTISPECIES: TRAP transporter substrate-binding protein DctP [unclassified Seohaeicola]MDD9707975.1 TRAP transporter substrate-binding protein DctP [Seohaeicola sp. 4SK31]MDD9736890.1 TRAP transporter substrate-binding protein DctP [Seohaeicola sp. SP36]